ncbi:MAG: tyrosine-type recombinase/integrase, partial [Litorimonas sp.]
MATRKAGQGGAPAFRASQFPGTPSNMPEMRLHDTAGNRLYLNAEERAAFLAAARRQTARDRTLCETLHHTGCRPSELVEITPSRVDLSGGTVTIRSLKKRRDASGRSRVVHRSVPVPPDYLDTMGAVH